MAAAETPFRCRCGQIEGALHAPQKRGIHLVCFCDSCRAGALHCGDAPPRGQPVDLYLTQPENVTIHRGSDKLEPFVFSPRGIIRWKAGCCGVQMFSSQPDPRTAFMSVRADRFDNVQDLGPVVCRSFIPKGNGKTKHEGIGALMKLIAGAVRARLTGKWRQTPLYDTGTLKPIKQAELISKEAKRALLS